MYWLAKINLYTVIKRLGSLRSAVLLFALIGICLYCGYRIGNFFHGYQTQTLAVQKQRLDRLYNEQNDSVKTINILELELEVERLSNARASSTIKEMEVELYQLKKELAFYQKIMAPEKEVDGLVIDGVTISATESANHFRFVVVLLQQKLRKSFAKGYVEITLEGSREGFPDTLKLPDISNHQEESLEFNFQYFQHIEGEFTLPEGFIAEKVNVSAILVKNKWQKYQRLDQSFPWPIGFVEDSSEELQVILD